MKGHPVRLRGERAHWTSDEIQKQVNRGQMVRGYSPWGSSPFFPTGDMGAHRRQRGRRLVIDYRKVNKHVQRARYRLRASFII